MQNPTPLTSPAFASPTPPASHPFSTHVFSLTHIHNTPSHAPPHRHARPHRRIYCVSHEMRRSVIRGLSFTFLATVAEAKFRLFSLRSASASASASAARKSVPEPHSLTPPEHSYAPVYHVRVLRKLPHDHHAFTQGLAYATDTHLFESTGKYGHSSVRRIELTSGNVVQRTRLTQSEFGEGLTVLNDRLLLQVLWKTGHAHIYDRDSLACVSSFDFPLVNDAWGVASPTSTSTITSSPTTNTSSSSSSSSLSSSTLVYVSDGTARIRVFRISISLDSERPNELTNTSASARLEREFIVTDGDRLVGLLNELEFVHGELWANVFMAKLIARIDVATGKVSSWLDCRTVLKPEDVPQGHKVNVLNGIAHDRDKGLVYITGKYWPTLYAIQATTRLSEQSAFNTGNAFFLDAGQVDYIHEYLIG